MERKRMRRKVRMIVWGCRAVVRMVLLVIIMWTFTTTVKGVEQSAAVSPAAVPESTQEASTKSEETEPKGTKEPKVDVSQWSLLSRLIYAEAGNCSDECLYAVGSVVLNRVASDKFPDTLEEVIYQDGQYAVVENGKIENESDKRCDKIAIRLLQYGSTIPDDVVYQAMFAQGEVWKKIDTEVFCYED